MKYTVALVGLAAAVTAIPGGQYGIIAPQAPAPVGCSASFSGEFQITSVSVAAKRDLAARGECGVEGSLTITLTNGVLTDSKGRIGSIVSNFQFQFDGPPAQAGAIYTAGFSACTNGSLALGGSAVFYQCLSGSFYNLYDRSWAAQCSAVEISMLPCYGSGSSPIATGTYIAQPQGTPVAQITDGQPQAAPVIPISEKSDGQPNVPTAAPPKITQIGGGQVQAPAAGYTAAPQPPVAYSPPKPAPGTPISQIPDGQIQASNVTVVTPSIPHYTGGASLYSMGVEFTAVVAGVAAIYLL